MSDARWQSGLGFDPYMTSLLNLPFGLLQFIVILLGSWLAYTFKNKGFILAGMMLPVVTGVGMCLCIACSKMQRSMQSN